MKRSKHEYFLKGVANQKAPDIVFDMRRKENADLSQLTEDKKADLLRWMGRVSSVFETFISEMKNELNK